MTFFALSYLKLWHTHSRFCVFYPQCVFYEQKISTAEIYRPTLFFLQPHLSPCTLCVECIGASSRAPRGKCEKHRVREHNLCSNYCVRSLFLARWRQAEGSCVGCRDADGKKLRWKQEEEWGGGAGQMMKVIAFSHAILERRPAGRTCRSASFCSVCLTCIWTDHPFPS